MSVSSLYRTTIKFRAPSFGRRTSQHSMVVARKSLVPVTWLGRGQVGRARGSLSVSAETRRPPGPAGHHREIPPIHDWRRRSYRNKLYQGAVAAIAPRRGEWAPRSDFFEVKGVHSTKQVSRTRPPACCVLVDRHMSLQYVTLRERA